MFTCSMYLEYSARMSFCFSGFDAKFGQSSINACRILRLIAKARFDFKSQAGVCKRTTKMLYFVDFLN